MIPAALFAILAISRLGAIHAVVFGGFAPAALAQRIEASKPIALMTASCGIEGSKGPLPYNAIVEEALRRSTCKPGKVIIWQRDQMRWDPILEEKGERSWQDLVRKAKNRGLKADAVPIKSSDGLYIIYTSGKCQFLDKISLSSYRRLIWDIDIPWWPGYCEACFILHVQYQ